MKKKIVVFSGAGLDKESGIATFRDSSSGLWNNYNINEVCTPEGWKKDPQKVLDFYNERRREMPNVTPNDAHYALVALEEEYDVIHVTQNVSDLLERAGATTIYHLHGELTKARGSYGTGNINPIVSAVSKPFDIGYEDIKLGDKCKAMNTQIRPHIVWFSEYPFHIERAYNAFEKADIVLVVGTSLNISYTLSFFNNLKQETKIIFIDPNPTNILTYEAGDIPVEYVKKKATKGVKEVVDRLIVLAVNENNN